MTEAELRRADPAVLKKRARRLARKPTEKSVREVAEEVAVVAVGDGLYGITVAALESVVRTPPISRLPGLPPWMRGIAQIRGRMLSAVDGGRWLGEHGHGHGEQRYFAVLSTAEGQLGLIIDRIIGFRTVHVDEIVDSLHEGGDQKDRPVLAVTRDLLHLLNVEALFRAADLSSSEPSPKENSLGLASTSEEGE